ncbi:MAG: cell division protein SepF [Clostridiales bacterium]|nr:cell division protein SepF [Clostridiales bacterium]
MSIFSKLVDAFRLNDGDDDYFDGEDDYGEDKPARKGFFSSRDDDGGYEEVEDEKPRFFSRSPKVVPMKNTGLEVSMIKPTSIEDAREICDLLLGGKAVVLNMEGIHMEVAQRIIDFTSGATYSMDGNLQKISSYIFIATPHSVQLSGDFQELLSDGNLGVSGMNIHL